MRASEAWALIGGADWLEQGVTVQGFYLETLDPDLAAVRAR